MADIYSNAFLNIAATAARNSFEGLFSERGPRWLWNDEIDINIGGMPGTEGPMIRRCTITAVSFWEDYVDHAPLNTRGWVLQERSLSPRQVNFCSDQVTWECSEYRKSERQPEGLPRFIGKAQNFVHGTALESFPLNGASAEVNGYQDSAVVLRDVYDSWKRIVERYTRAKLTKPEDKLIALSGIAQRMHIRINGLSYSPNRYDPQSFDPKQYEYRYLAGMWDYNLQSQLLWYVEPPWDARNEGFRYLSKRPGEYRAPSWSWAAVDADHGITYGEALEHDEFLFKVADVNVTPKDGGPFGTVKRGSLVLSSDVQAEKIELQQRRGKEGTSYSWKIVERDGKRFGPKFCIIWLDSPASDRDIFAVDARIYCLPAARRHQGTEFTCLLLKELSSQENNSADQGRHFARVGLTCIPSLDAEGIERLKSWSLAVGKGQYEFHIS